MWRASRRTSPLCRGEVTCLCRPAYKCCVQDRIALAVNRDSRCRVFVTVVHWFVYLGFRFRFSSSFSFSFLIMFVFSLDVDFFSSSLLVPSCGGYSGRQEKGRASCCSWCRFTGLFSFRLHVLISLSYVLNFVSFARFSFFLLLCFSCGRYAEGKGRAGPPANSQRQKHYLFIVATLQKNAQEHTKAFRDALLLRAAVRTVTGGGEGCAGEMFFLWQERGEGVSRALLQASRFCGAVCRWVSFCYARCVHTFCSMDVPNLC